MVRTVAKIGLAAGMAGIVTVIFSFTEQHSKQKNTVESRIELLTKNLQESSRIISEIEVEYKLRAELLEKLKKDAEQAESLSKLHGQEVAAIAQALEATIDKKTKWDVWISVIQNVFFTIFGVAAGEIWSRYKNK